MQIRPLAALALAISISGSASAETRSVPEDYPTLSAASAAAIDGDEVLLAPGTYRPGRGETFPLVITRHITVRGAGALRTVLDAGARSAHFRVHDTGHLTLVGVTLARGKERGFGGAVRVDGGTLVTSRVRFTANAASGGGDAVAVRGGAAWFLNCLFDENRGAGATLLSLGGDFVIEQSTFATNAGVAIEGSGRSRIELSRSVVVAPGSGTSPAIGLRLGPRAVLAASDNLFDRCFDGLVVDLDQHAVRTADAAHRIGHQGLRREVVSFVDPLAIDYRLASPAADLSPAGASFPGAYGGAAPFGGRMSRPATSGEDRTGLLGPSAPNPGRSFLRIPFSVPVATVVDLGIYNVLGQRVRTLVSRDVAEGEHTEVWDGRDDSGEELPPGIYFVRVTQGMVTESRRLAVVR